MATETACRYCKEGFQCPDCYFDELSDILEQKSITATDEEVKDLFESKEEDASS